VEATQFECRKRLVPAEALRLSELGRRALEEGMLIVAGTIESTIMMLEPQVESILRVQ